MWVDTGQCPSTLDTRHWTPHIKFEIYYLLRTCLSPWSPRNTALLQRVAILISAEQVGSFWVGKIGIITCHQILQFTAMYSEKTKPGPRKLGSKKLSQQQTLEILRKLLKLFWSNFGSAGIRCKISSPQRIYVVTNTYWKTSCYTHFIRESELNCTVILMGRDNTISEKQRMLLMIIN